MFMVRRNPLLTPDLAPDVVRESADYFVVREMLSILWCDGCCLFCCERGCHLLVGSTGDLYFVGREGAVYCVVLVASAALPLSPPRTTILVNPRIMVFVPREERGGCTEQPSPTTTEPTWIFCFLMRRKLPQTYGVSNP